jgi:DNA-binding IclR family transcriptional regulator
MAFMTHSVDKGFDRFQQILLGMRVGDTMRATEAAEATGLSVEVCHAVLEGLQRAGLMVHESDGRFVRRSLDLARS